MKSKNLRKRRTRRKKIRSKIVRKLSRTLPQKTHVLRGWKIWQVKKINRFQIKFCRLRRSKCFINRLKRELFWRVYASGQIKRRSFKGRNSRLSSLKKSILLSRNYKRVLHSISKEFNILNR